MAAGLGFKTFTTGEVLTAGDVNGYLMQGVLVFADAAARTAAITSPQEGQVSYLKNTNSTEYYSGSAWVAVGGSSPLTTKGDLYTYSTTDTRLASSGVNNDVLTVDTSTATGLKWASSGGMTLISTTTLTGSSVTLSSIPSGYVSLYLELTSVRPSADDTSVFVRVNGDSTANRYIENAAVSNFGYPFNTTVFRLMQAIDNGADALNQSFTVFPNYDNTNNWKVSQTLSVMSDATVPTYANWFNNNIGIYNQTTAITSLVILPSGGTFTSGTALLYGVK